MSGSEGHTVIAADVGGQAALLKKPLKYSKGVIFFGRRKGFASEEITESRASLQALRFILYRVCAAQDVPFGARYNGLLEPQGIALLFLMLLGSVSIILDKGPLRDT